MKRRILMALTLAAAFAPRARAADLPPSAVPIAAFNDALLAVMHAGPSTSFAARMQMLRPLVERAFSLPLILRNSIGPRWTSFTPAQQAQLLEAFTNFTVASWVANFDTYDGERFEILPDLRTIGSDQVVQTRIVPRNGDPTRLDYVMRNSGNAWKAVDILLNGSISRVAVQRSDFRSQLTSSDPTPLIGMLREKVAALAAGAKT
jgi:phospholipid transport system substrate-binding protein